MKQIIEKNNQSVILLPSFKSILDFALLSYIHMIYEIDLPFVAGLKEYDKIALVSTILRRCGGYMVDRKSMQD